MKSRLTTAFAISLTCLTTMSCAPTALPAKSEILNTLSAVLLTPDSSCDQLAGYFGLSFLSPVETPDQMGLDFNEYWVVGDNGSVLHLWHMPAALKRGTIVLSAGAAGQMACYLFPAQLLINNGWSVIMYDYQGFGQSEGSPDLASLAGDLETVLDWSRVLTGRDQLTLMGISIGSIPSIAVGVKRPDAVNALIIDSPVALGAELDRFGFLFGGRVEDIVGLIDEELVSEVIVADLTQPLLVFLSERDSVTPPRTIELLFENAGGPKEIVRFPNIDHALGPYVKTALYTVHLESFLTCIWRGQ